MLRSKLEPRLRGLIAFSVVAVLGALVSGLSAQTEPPKVAAVPGASPRKVVILSVNQGQPGTEGRRITIVRVGPDCPPPEPPATPPPSGAVL